MTTLATTSSLRKAIIPEVLTRARRRLLTAEPDPTRANTPTSGSLTGDQLRVLAVSDWAPPCMTALDANTLAPADTVTRALLAESVRETLERRLAAERPTAPTTTREQDTTPSLGESSTTTTTATTTSREPPSAQPNYSLRADAGARHRRTRLPVERGRLAMIYIIAYDIADNKRRLRVAKTQESWGYRIQESVFQLRLDAATLARVLGSSPSFQRATTSSTSTPSAHPAPAASTCSAQP